MLSFRAFDLETDPRCRYDYLDVYNGQSNQMQKLNRLCGTRRPGSLISTTNTITLEMVSDEATQGKGFLAYFSGAKPYVDGMLFLNDISYHVDKYVHPGWAYCCHAAKERLCFTRSNALVPNGRGGNKCNLQVLDLLLAL